MKEQTRTERLLRLARQRGDRAAIAILEGAALARARDAMHHLYWAQQMDAIAKPRRDWTEAELRAAWGDR